MDVTDDDRLAAEERMDVLLQSQPRAVRVRYDRHRARIVIRLNTGLDLALPVRLAQGLKGAAEDDLGVIEISPTGLGLHWPRLDADLYVPSLLAGRTGSAAWMVGNSRVDDGEPVRRVAAGRR